MEILPNMIDEVVWSRTSESVKSRVGLLRFVALYDGLHGLMCIVTNAKFENMYILGTDDVHSWECIQKRDIGPWMAGDFREGVIRGDIFKLF